MYGTMMQCLYLSAFISLVVLKFYAVEHFLKVKYKFLLIDVEFKLSHKALTETYYIGFIEK
jgi:hypothetical protein